MNTQVPEKKAAHAFVYGRVQGVGFRYWVKQAARMYGVNGWVRNCPDYSVEIFAEQTPAILYEFFEEVKHNHPYAHVTECIVNPIPYQGCRSFTIRY